MSFYSSDGVHGFVDDYAFLIRGLLDLYETVYDEQWLELAYDLQHMQDKQFWDSIDGGYYTSDGKDPSIILRMKDGNNNSTTYERRSYLLIVMKISDGIMFQVMLFAGCLSFHFNMLEHVQISMR